MEADDVHVGEDRYSKTIFHKAGDDFDFFGLTPGFYLDALFGEEALDISTDITVMENLLAQEGLTGMDINEAKKDEGGIHLEL